MEKFKIIEDYLNGDLNPFEKSKVENAIGENDEWKEEYQLRKEVNQAIAENELMQFRDQIDAIMVKNDSPAYKSPIRKLKRSVNKKVVVAASFIFLLGIGGMSLYLNNQAGNNQQIFEKYYQPYEVTINIRSADTELNSILTRAMQQYKQHNYHEALTLFKTVLNKKDDMAASLYSGISYMEVEKYKKANQSFKTVIDNEKNLFVEQAKWYMSMCYIKMKENEKASALLKELEEESSFYRRDARKILKKLD